MWPFTRRNGSEKMQPAIDLVYDETFLRIKSLDFFGQYARSANGRYTIAWRDSDPAGYVGGHRDKGEGDYVLLDGESVLAHGRMQRPNDGKVADNGRFVINDWLFGDGLKGIFYAFELNGSAILSKRFRANLDKSGISLDGSLAVCQTLYSDNEDANLLTLFDLSQKLVIAQWRPQSGAASGYEFEAPTRKLFLVYGGRAYQDYADPKWAYSFDGEFLDRDRWLADKLKWGDFSTLIMTVEDLLKVSGASIDPPRCRMLLKSVELAIQKGADGYPDWHAHALKLSGILHEQLGELPEAIALYGRALALNPKIGVKRRLVALTKKVIDYR
ncbi:MAG: tetratricopeptide repeat protein [Candidatus Binatus sp.]|uniref:tetratricopeptide repeat protein n=1 Tax=Candidatus Binatus sp. TaxID=2811406 RepID=UPI0027220D4C|nr:tetratricopeptide repeat protein [Candidatus Binatus sp.]MDO8434130.1 tetratricopeptide repeat protein [Candidatus Binatus sp.]